ncbi:hypothetical protein LguiB_026191 [Lonicera macranthoides]
MGSAECRERNGNNKEGEDGTMMKAPGQNVVSIKREDFENNPKEYFQRIHGSSISKKEEEDGPMMKAPGQKVDEVNANNPGEVNEYVSDKSSDSSDGVAECDLEEEIGYEKHVEIILVRTAPTVPKRRGRPPKVLRDFQPTNAAQNIMLGQRAHIKVNEGGSQSGNQARVSSSQPSTQTSTQAGRVNSTQPATIAPPSKTIVKRSVLSQLTAAAPSKRKA